MEERQEQQMTAAAERTAALTYGWRSTAPTAPLRGTPVVQTKDLLAAAHDVGLLP
ncbi:hypothetical protein [Streptomyces sp. KL110A]|uniref:hypothetical protein n=1 Tax=Streptomyces sp. KL110A TaxID=3384221 RepID=UPI0038C9194D